MESLIETIDEFLEDSIDHIHATIELLRVEGYVPLSVANWVQLLYYWRYFALVGLLMLAIDYYPMGKTSNRSIFNVPGKPAWIFMELLSPLSLLFAIFSNPNRDGPMSKNHAWLTTMYLMHYFHRAIISPLMNPSMAPTHVGITIAGAVFNIINGTLIGGWIGGYGSADDVPRWQIILGTAIFLAGLWGNMYHEEVLREIRRDGKVDAKAEKEGKVVRKGDRIYTIPKGGLFNYIWHPHYFSEWIEWTGFTIAGGGPQNFLPAAMFVGHEIAILLPRALQGKRWYAKHFGKNTPDRKAIVPGVL
ncbi:hypothetical protein RUND412_001045 [Rhizina undulata]